MDQRRKWEQGVRSDNAVVMEVIMENLKNVISLLQSVELTMDTISVTGIDNQDKFVGCAMSIRTAAKQISDYIAVVEACAEKQEDTSNG